MKKLIAGLFGIVCSICGCTAQDNNYKSLDVEAFEKAIADTLIVRLDVRTAEEYADGHIANTINIDVLKDDFEQKATSTLSKKQTIAVYCRSGRRSKNAAEILVKYGYKVIELNSGFNGWSAANKPTTKE